MSGGVGGVGGERLTYPRELALTVPLLATTVVSVPRTPCSCTASGSRKCKVAMAGPGGKGQNIKKNHIRDVRVIDLGLQPLDCSPLQDKSV